MSKDNTSLTAECSKCRSVFRVQPQHLAAAKGWLQCGVCGNVFHTTFEEAPEVQEPIAVQTEPVVSAEAEVPSQELASAELQQAPIADEASPEETPQPAEVLAEETSESDATGPATLTGLAKRMADEGANASIGPKLESIILLDPDIPADDLGPMPTFESPDQPPRPASESPTLAARVSTATEKAWIPRQPLESSQTKEKPRTWLWSLAGVFLLVILASQLIFFLRDDLAVRYPQIRPQLMALCQALDCKLTLPRDTKLVTILGSDLQTESSGNLALAVTLANRAKHVMAWPVLELTLTDIKDQPIGRRVFAPSEYLPSPELESAGIQPLSEVPLTLKLQTRDIKAVGYRLQMFY